METNKDTCVIEAITDPDTGETLGWVCTINRYNGLRYDIPHYTRFQGVGETANEAQAKAKHKREQEEKRDTFDAGGEWMA